MDAEEKGILYTGLATLGTAITAIGAPIEAIPTVIAATAFGLYATLDQAADKIAPAVGQMVSDTFENSARNEHILGRPYPSASGDVPTVGDANPAINKKALDQTV